MTIEISLVLIFLVAFGFLLYAGPSYFRRLRIFFNVIERNHHSTFKMLHEPDLTFANITIRSAFSVVMYVIHRGYVELHDETAIELGDAVRWRLIASLVSAGAIAIVIPLASTMLK